jgi:hypothetical protein
MLQRLCIFVLAILLTGGMNAWVQLPSNELEGTWRMVSQEFVYPDSVVDQSGNCGANYKILNSTHFSWGRETEEGESVLAGGGRYEYHPERDLYVEHIQYHSDPALSGATLRLEARVVTILVKSATTSCVRSGSGSIRKRFGPSSEGRRRPKKGRQTPGRSSL